MGKKLTYEQRQCVIVSTAVMIANRDGLTNVTYKSVSKECFISTSEATVRFYFRRHADLWRAVLIENQCSNEVRNEAVALGVL